MNIYSYESIFVFFKGAVSAFLMKKNITIVFVAALDSINSKIIGLCLHSLLSQSEDFKACQSFCATTEQPIYGNQEVEPVSLISSCPSF